MPARVAAIHGATALVSAQTSFESGILALQGDGRVVSCHYQVGANESESSPRLLCQSDRAPGAKLLAGTQLAIRRAPPIAARVTTVARATIPRVRRRASKLARP